MAITDTIGNIGKSASFGSVLSSVGNVGHGISGAIKKIRSLSKDQNEPSTIRDLNTNGFSSQDSLFVPNFFTRTFDEPTYLTFRIEFNFGDPESAKRNFAYNNNGMFNSDIDHSLYDTMFDYLPEPLLEPFSVVNVSYTGTENDKYGQTMDTSTGKTYSTEDYLDRSLGDHGRAYLLHNFKLALRDIQDNFPYYLKSISGINSLFKVQTETGARLSDAKITIDCYEALDLRITQLLNMYKKIVWDDVYQRWVLPDMMRYFNMKIYISEIRLFHDVQPNKPKNENFLFDFSNPSVRNATTSPLLPDKDKWWEKGLNGLKTANALANTFLGTKSHLTKAINTVASTIDVGKGLYNDFASAFNDLNMCNSAFNEVMPTICIDCHMCEFDISDTMTHLDSLKSAKPEQPTPKITIKVGNARDTQVYPLNATLKISNDGYSKTVQQYLEKSSLPSVSEANIQKHRDDPNGIMFMGNYLSDEALMGKYTNTAFDRRQNEYIDHLIDAFGRVKGETPMNKRMNQRMRNDSSKMSYPRGYIPQELAQMSLTATGIQEAQSIIGAFDKEGGVDLEYIIGTHSTATSPDKATRQAVYAIGETLNEALDKIYNGEEMKSMALSEEAKNKIASDMFEEYINNLYFSTATDENSILHKILEEYKVLIDNEEGNGTNTENKTEQSIFPDKKTKESIRNNFKFNDLN